MFLCAAFLPLPACAIGSITILGDKALAPAIAQIARNYTRDQGVVASTSFIDPIRQELEITEGGSADVLITPKQEWIDSLKTQGLLDVYSQTLIAKDRLALVGPQSSEIVVGEKFPATPIIKDIKGQPLFAVGNPETLREGSYTKEALRNMNVSGVLGEYTVYIKKREEMFDIVQKHGGYGVFFYSTIINKPGLKVVDLLPQTMHTPVAYYAVVIAGDNMDEARRFIEYLKSYEVQDVLSRSGFTLQ